MDMHPRTHPGRPLILAHRGASHHAPQNTMAAFRLAAEMGADGIELDVHLSRDGHAVVIHNETVEGTTNGSGRVADLSLAELQELDAGGWHGAAYAGEHIPTLAGVLGELGPRLIVNVEIKTQALLANDLEAEVVRLIEDHSMVHRVVVSSFSPFALWRVRRLNPNIPTGLLYSPDLPLALRKRWFQPLAQPKALHPRWDMIDRGFVSRAHGQGLAVNTWTCNTPDGMRQLIDWGVDAIITDRPDLLHELLAGRPHSHQRDR